MDYRRTTRAALADCAAMSVLAVACVAAPARAQEVPQDATQADNTPAPSDIIVTGSRFQTQKTIEAKRKSLTVVDTSSQDDIGALPDQNVAESLRRIPGVTSPLDEDEGRFVVVRGIDPSLNFVGLDGLSLATTDDFAGGGRRVNLEVIPGRAVEELQVYKTFTADLDAGAIGGVVNLVPRSAWDSKKTYFVADAGANYFTYGDVPGVNSLGGPKNARVSGEGDFVFSKVFGSHDQFGIVLSGGYQQKQRDESKDIQPQELYFTAAGKTTTPDKSNWNGYTVPGEFSFYSYTNRVRDYGGSVRLEWRPSSSVYTSLLLYDYKKGESESRNRNRVLSFKTPTNVTPTSGDLVATSSRIGYNFNTLDRNNLGAQWRTSATVARNTDLDFRAGYSFNNFNDYEPSIEYRYTPNKKIHYDTSTFINTYTLDAADSYNNPANYKLNTWQQKYRYAREQTYDARLDLAHNIRAGDTGFGYQAGASWRRLERRVNNSYFNYKSDNSLMTGYSLLPGFVPPGDPYPVMWIDARKFIDDVAPRLAADRALSAQNSLLEDFQYREDVTALYGSAAYATDNFRAIAGLRYDHVDTLARSPQELKGVLQPDLVATKGHYQHLLPSLNLLYAVSPDFRIKAAYSRSLGRPNPADLAQVEDRDDVNLTISRGNPNLRPRVADNLDLAFEKYFAGKDGLFSVAFFYKHIKDNIFTLETQETIDGSVYDVTEPVNADAAHMKGVEVALIDNRLRFLPGPFRLLGFSANATYVDGSMAYRTDAGVRTVDRLPFQTTWSGNAALFYNWKGNELRVAANYQGEYLDGLGASYWLDSGWKPYTTVDVTARFALTDHLKLKLEARNIGDQNRYHIRGIDLSDLYETVEFGRSYFAKLTYVF